MSVPKNSHHNLIRRRNCLYLRQSLFTVRGPLFRLLFGIKSIVVDPSLISGYESIKNLVGLRTQLVKLSVETSFRCCFWSSVSICGTHLTHSFAIHRCSCKILYIVPQIYQECMLSCSLSFYSLLKRFCNFFLVQSL